LGYVKLIGKHVDILIGRAFRQQEMSLVFCFTQIMNSWIRIRCSAWQGLTPWRGVLEK
jgi:hypothetical protein